MTMKKYTENYKKSQYFPNLIETSHHFVQSVFQKGGSAAHNEYALDGTAGNGHDTLFLAKLTGAGGRVFGYDVQEKALEATRAALSREGLEGRVTLFAHGHEHIAADLAAFFRAESPRPMLRAAMFNFGFLPGSDKTCVTQPHTSLAALEGLMPWMHPGAGVSLHLYAGHAGGEREVQTLVAWASRLPWDRCRVMRHEFLNKEKNREILLLIEVLQKPAGCPSLEGNP